MAIRLPPMPITTPAPAKIPATGCQILLKGTTSSSCIVSELVMPLATALYSSHWRPKSDDGTEQTQQQTLEHERPADKVIGSTHHLHDGDLLTPVKGGKLDGIGNNQQRNHQQNGDKRHGNNACHVADGDKAGRNGFVCPNLINTRHRLYRRFGFCDPIRIRQVDHITVAEYLRLEVLIHIVLIVFGHIGIPCLLTGDKGAVGHVVHLFQLVFQRLGLTLRQGVVHKGHHGILLLQISQIHVGVVSHQRKGTHDQQTGHRDADGGKGHKTMGKHAAGTLFEEITQIFHCCATPSYVPVASPTTRPLSR